jgi:L-arabinose isomerase
VIHCRPARFPVWRLRNQADTIRRACLDATSSDECAGVVAWMHTFSPAKMWIGGLEALRKPLLHLHTQANISLPWSEIAMDFMNLNQAAHGDREFGYIQSRLGVARKIVAGHVSDPVVAERVETWTRAALGWRAAQSLRMARFGDNMRNVAVTRRQGRGRARVRLLREHMGRRASRGRRRRRPRGDADAGGPV